MAIPTPVARITRFEKMGYGMFIHWGLYAQLGQGEWVQHLRKIPMDEYAQLKEKFTAEDFDGRKIAQIAKAAGMKYITLTSRHHDGFSLYDTKGLSDHDAPHSPAGRDLVAELIEGCRAEGIAPHFYHTTLDWYQPSFEEDFDAYLDYLNQSIEVLCTSYGEIGGLWFDGNWSKPDADWKENRLYSMIRKYQPEAMIVNNTGLHALGHIGHPEIDSVTFEQGRPSPMDREGMEKYVATEMCQTMNRHWGIGADFGLETDDCVYLFIHNLAGVGDAHVTVGGGGVGPRGFTHFDRPVAGVHWIDNDEELRFAHEGGLLCIEATGYPYGVDRVVRVAEVK